MSTKYQSHQTPASPPCRGCSELYRMPVSDYKSSSSDSGSFEYKFPFRSNNNKWQRTSSSPQQSLTASPQPHTPNRAISLGSSVGKTLSAERLERGAAIPRSVSSDGRPLDPKRLEAEGWVGSVDWALNDSHRLWRYQPIKFACHCLTDAAEMSWKSPSWKTEVGFAAEHLDSYKISNIRIFQTQTSREKD